MPRSEFQHRWGGSVGTEDICLPVHRTEGADYSRWGFPPSPWPPWTWDLPARAGSFHASKLSADTSQLSTNSGPTEVLWVGRTSINGTFIQSPASCSTQFGVNQPPATYASLKALPPWKQVESSLHLLCCENEENRIWMRIAGHWIWIDCALHCNAHYVGPLCILGTASPTQCEW